jgi:hypothetical protein
MEIKADILEYLGKVDDGIIVLLSLSYDGEYYESTLYYKDRLVALTPGEKLEDKIGSVIEDWEGYNDLMLDILKRVVPYEEMIARCDEIDMSQYGIGLGNSSES